MTIEDAINHLGGRFEGRGMGTGLITSSKSKSGG